MNQAESGLAGLERVIGHILRVGIVASSICLASALVMMLTGKSRSSLGEPTASVICLR